MSEKWVPLVRAGQYPQGSITAEMLRDLERNTNNVIQRGSYEPPLKLAHGDNGDAQGYIRRVRADGSLLFGEFGDVSDDLRERMRAKRRRWLSAEIDLDFSFSGANGDEVGPVLTGVAILGAKMPQMRGLVDLSQIEFSATTDMSEARNAGIVSDGTVTAERRQMYFAEFDDNTQLLEDSMSEKELQDLKDQNAALVAEKERLEKLAFDAAHEGHVAFAAQMSREAKITEGEKDGLVATLDNLFKAGATTAIASLRQSYEARQPVRVAGGAPIDQGGEEKKLAISRADFEAANKPEGADAKAIAKIDEAVRARCKASGKPYAAEFEALKSEISFA